MAATVSSVWSKPGAWALDSEQNEHELSQPLPTPTPEPPASDFPSLSAAATTKPKKKNKAQTLSLAQFSSYSAPRPTDQPISLPTGPRQRTAEELAQAQTRGFRNFDRDANPRGPAREREPLGPSRADEADDWSRTKKFGSFGSDRPERGERDNGPSRADEVDDWSKGKKFGGGGFGGGERREKVGFFNSSRADEVDNWGANKSYVPGAGTGEGRRERRVGFEGYSTGPGADGESWGRSKVMGESNIGSGSGRPRLNLQPRTLPVNPIVVVANGGGGSPKEEVMPRERVKGANPFGEARPREEVLKEKGQDWKEIDEKLEAVRIKEEKGGEGFGRRRGFGIGSGGGGEERRSWRKPEGSEGAVTPTASSVETTENGAAEVNESSEKAPEEN